MSLRGERIQYWIKLPPRPKLVMSINPNRLTSKERQAIEKVILRWELEELEWG